MGVRPVLPALLIALGCAAAHAAEPLRVCLDDANPPYSDKAHGGFDVAFGQAVAAHAGRAFEARWYDNGRDNDRAADRDVEALLADGVCDLAASFPLEEGLLDPPAQARAKVPAYEGGPARRALPTVTVDRLVPSRPYARMVLALIVAPTAGTGVHALGDLTKLRLVAPVGTLAEAVLITWHRSALRDNLHSIDAREPPLEALADGRADATLVELGRWDAFRAAHPGTALRDTGYRHGLGINLGYVTRPGRDALLADVDAAIEALLADGTAARLADAAGLSFVAPVAPDITPRLTAGSLIGVD